MVKIREFFNKKNKENGLDSIEFDRKSLEILPFKN